MGALTALVLTEINSVGNFTALRFVQGFFGAAPVVLSGALLRDLFSKDQLSKVMSTITLVFMLAPLVAPIIGVTSLNFSIGMRFLRYFACGIISRCIGLFHHSRNP